MSHRDPVSHNKGLAADPQAEALSGTGPGIEQKPVSEAATGSINGASKTVITLPLEIGGRDGPEPTRYGDWEKAGRCIDF